MIHIIFTRFRDMILWEAFKHSVFFIVIPLLLVQWSNLLGYSHWPQTRCQMLRPSTLTVSQLQHVLELRAIDHKLALEKQELITLVEDSGGVMVVELEMMSRGHFHKNDELESAEDYETFDELVGTISSGKAQTVLVIPSGIKYLLFVYKEWKEFQRKLEWYGIDVIGCFNERKCQTHVFLIRRKGRSEQSWFMHHFVGTLDPDVLFLWIFETLKGEVSRVSSSSVIVNDWKLGKYRGFSEVTLVAHTSFPVPFSYALLASEFREKVRFVWVEDFDSYIPDRSTLIVLSPRNALVFDYRQFLTHTDIQFLLKNLLVTLGELAVKFLMLSTILVLVGASGGIRKRLKALLIFYLESILFLLGFFYLLEYFDELSDVVDQITADILWHLHPHLLRLNHLFSEQPKPMAFASVSLVFIVTHGSQITRFFERLWSSLSLNSLRVRFPEKPKRLKISRSSALKTISLSKSAGRSNQPRAPVSPKEPSLPVSSQSSPTKNVTTASLDNIPRSNVQPRRPFEFPPLGDIVEDGLDKQTVEQIRRLSIPRYWLRPIFIPVDYVRQLDLQPIKTWDELNLDSASRTTTPRCFFCGTNFQPTSEVLTLKCRDIFHRWCIVDWVKEENHDCPACHQPLYSLLR